MNAARGGPTSTSYSGRQSISCVSQNWARRSGMSASRVATKAQAIAQVEFSKFQGLGNDFLLVRQTCAKVYDAANESVGVS